MSAATTQPPTVDSLITAALALPPADRARVLDALQESLDPVDPAIEAAWIEETRKRVEALDRGEMATFPYEEVLKELDELCMSASPRPRALN